MRPITTQTIQPVATLVKRIPSVVDHVNTKPVARYPPMRTRIIYSVATLKML
uniref:Uncharacterized protein n=1 Tax=viral metagenome TaxID=1070528 RepID=A0A6C0HIW0_9ZZZZ